MSYQFFNGIKWINYEQDAHIEASEKLQNIIADIDGDSDEDSDLGFELIEPNEPIEPNNLSYYIFKEANKFYGEAFTRDFFTTQHVDGYLLLNSNCWRQLLLKTSDYEYLKKKRNFYKRFNKQIQTDEVKINQRSVYRLWFLSKTNSNPSPNPNPNPNEETTATASTSKCIFSIKITSLCQKANESLELLDRYLGRHPDSFTAYIHFNAYKKLADITKPDYYLDIQGKLHPINKIKEEYYKYVHKGVRKFLKNLI